MKPIKEKGKLFGLINAVDFLIIAALVLVIAGGVYIFGSGMFSKGETIDVYFTVEFTDMKDWFSGIAGEGDVIKDSVKGNYLGTVYNVEERQSQVETWSFSSEVFEKVDVPGELTVLVTVKGKGIVTESDILVEGQPIKVGREMFIKGKGYAQAGYCTALWPKPGAVVPDFGPDSVPDMNGGE